MHQAYSMVVVNLIGSLIVLFGTLFYRLIYPKKPINLFILLLIIAVLPIISIFRLGAYESGDFDIHIYRTMAFFSSLSQGHLIPSWAENLNATYGYPLFIFNYTLPYYILSFFHLIGFSFITSLKIFLGLNLILSGVFMYKMSKELFKNDLAAFTSAIFYIFAPYHLIATHFKITIGEILAFTLIPIIFTFLNRLIKKSSLLNLLMTGLFFGLLALSHIFIAIILVPIFFVYIIFYLRFKLKSLFYFVSIFLIGALISFYQWAPPLIYNKYLFIHLYPINTASLYYPSITDLLYSPWRFGLLFQGPKGEISSLIGYAQLLIVLFVLLLLIKNKIPKIHKPDIIAWLILLTTLVVLMIPFSKQLWINLPLISDAGVHRLLILVSLCTSILAGYFSLTNTKRKWLIWGIILLAIFSTVLNWGQRRVIPQINDSILAKNLSYSTSKGEAHFYANTRWVNPKQPWFSQIPSSHLEILNGKAQIATLERLSTKHKYIINASTPITVKENTLYFPGWEATNNGKPINIGPDKNGVITFSLPRGNNQIDLIYKDLFSFYVSKLISSLSIALFIFISLIYCLLILKQKA